MYYKIITYFLKVIIFPSLAMKTAYHVIQDSKRLCNLEISEKCDKCGSTINVLLHFGKVCARMGY